MELGPNGSPIGVKPFRLSGQSSARSGNIRPQPASHGSARSEAGTRRNPKFYIFFKIIIDFWRAAPDEDENYEMVITL